MPFVKSTFSFCRDLLLALRVPLFLLLLGPGTTRGQEGQMEDAPNLHDSVFSLGFSDTARCYSCMSRLYEAVWPSLRNVYRPPRNYTDACDNVSEFVDSLPVVHCPTICVSMAEEPNIAGIRVRGHIRGCMSDVLINGFNQTIVSWYRWMHRDSCRLYRKKELFKLPGELSDESTIEVCTCYSDNCNGYSSTTNTSYSSLFPIIVTFFCGLFSIEV